MDKGFFRWVWRFNAVVLAFGLLLLCAIALWEITREWRRDALQTQPSNALAIDPDADSAAPTEISRYFGVPLSRAGSPIYAVPLMIEQEYPSRGISKGNSNRLLNYRIINTADQSARWLFGEGEWLVADTRDIFLSTTQTDGRRTLGRILTVVEEDTNSDERLSRRDTKTLYFTDPDWSAPVAIAAGISSLLALEAVSASEIDIFAKTPDGTRVLRVSLPDGATLSEQTMTPLD